MSGRWTAPIYDHGKFGPFGAEVMVAFDLVEVPQRQAPGHYVHARCPCAGFAAASRDEMHAHLTELGSCLVRRSRLFWQNQSGFTQVTSKDRYTRILLESEVEVWRDIGGQVEKTQRNELFGARFGVLYQLHAEVWAWQIANNYHAAGTGKIWAKANKIWAKANKNDWLLRAILRRAKHNLEFRSAVTGLQRIASDPWVQYEAFQGWMKHSDTSNAKNM